MNHQKSLLLIALAAGITGCGGGGSDSDGGAKLAKSLFPTSADAIESGQGNNSQEVAEPIEIGEVFKRTIYPQRDIDWYEMDLSANTIYEISVNGVCQSCEVELSFYVEGNDSALEVSDEYFYYDRRIKFTSPIDAKFYARVQASDLDALSSYTFSAHEFIDADDDGFSDYYDCNDNNVNVYPEAEEIQGDGIDQDCNGSDLISDITADHHEGNDTYKKATLVPYMAGRWKEAVYINQQHSDDVHTIHDESDVDWLKVIVPPYSATQLDFRYYNFNPNIEVYESDGVTPYIPTDEAAVNTSDEDLVIYLKVMQNGVGYYMPQAQFVGYDKDQDGFYTEQGSKNFDCDDSNASINPMMEDLPNDGIDQDCDGFDATVNDI